MARRKINERNTRKLQNTAGSYYVSLPIEIIRNLKWKGGQKVVVKKLGKNRIVIEDWKK